VRQTKNPTTRWGFLFGNEGGFEPPVRQASQSEAQDARSLARPEGVSGVATNQSTSAVSHRPDPRFDKLQLPKLHTVFQTLCGSNAINFPVWSAQRLLASVRGAASLLVRDFLFQGIRTQ
jgi:hypothetical protein